MKVGLVSCVRTPSDEPGSEDLGGILELVTEHPDLDLLLFSGWTLMPGDYRTLLKQNENPLSIVILQEVGNGFPPVHVIQGRHDLSDGRTTISQLFADSRQADSTKLARLLHALENERMIRVAGKTARLIICGENNLLKNAQSEGNKVSFRDDGLADRFERIRSETDVFLNPAHTPMGNLVKLTRRWSYLSEKGRLCMYATNATGTRELGQKRLQYAFADGKVLQPSQGPVVERGLRLASYEWRI